MYCAGDIKSEFIERSKETKKLRKAWGDGNGEYGIPDKESNNGMLGNFALFPGDFGMCYISDYGSDGGSDKIGKPDKIIVLNDEIRKNCKKDVVE